jgi:hypothetical protein
VMHARKIARARNGAQGPCAFLPQYCDEVIPANQRLRVSHGHAPVSSPPLTRAAATAPARARQKRAGTRQASRSRAASGQYGTTPRVGTGDAALGRAWTHRATRISVRMVVGIQVIHLGCTNSRQKITLSWSRRRAQRPRVG